MYEFVEPEFETMFNVTLIRDDNRLSEQTFRVGIEVSDPTGLVRPATPQMTASDTSYDYRVSTTIGQTFFMVDFPPDLQSIPFTFFLNSDEVPEELEAFQASSTAVVGFPSFFPPLPSSNTAFQSTQIQIIDDDCKFFFQLAIVLKQIVYCLFVCSFIRFFVCLFVCFWVDLRLFRRFSVPKTVQIALVFSDSLYFDYCVTQCVT